MSSDEGNCDDDTDDLKNIKEGFRNCNSLKQFYYAFLVSIMLFPIGDSIILTRKKLKFAKIKIAFSNHSLNIFKL